MLVREFFQNRYCSVSSLYAKLFNWLLAVAVYLPDRYENSLESYNFSATINFQVSSAKL